MRKDNKQKGYEYYSASLRIMNAPKKHQEIEQVLGKATHEHKKGDQRIWKGNVVKNRFWPNDVWILESPLPKHYDFNKHLSWLSKKIMPHKDFLSRLKSRKIKIDIHCSYRTGSPTGGIEIKPRFYELLSELNISLGVSIQFDEPLFKVFKSIK